MNYRFCIQTKRFPNIAVWKSEEHRASFGYLQCFIDLILR